MKSSIKSSIELATYKFDELGDMYEYVGNTLDKLYGQSWQVFAFGCPLLLNSLIFFHYVSSKMAPLWKIGAYKWYYTIARYN